MDVKQSSYIIQYSTLHPSRTHLSVVSDRESFILTQRFCVFFDRTTFKAATHDIIAIFFNTILGPETQSKYIYDSDIFWSTLFCHF